MTSVDALRDVEEKQNKTPHQHDAEEMHAANPELGEQGNGTDEICANIARAAELTVQTGDYLSFATMIDFCLGDPFRFTTEEATKVLTCLYDTLNRHHSILYKVGWDFPELLLRYIDRFYVNDVQSLANQKSFRMVMSLFSLLSEKGNPHELVLRACELMLSTESELNSKGMAELSLADDTEPAHKEHVLRAKYQRQVQQKVQYTRDSANIDGSSGTFDCFDDTRQENIKFCTLFEIIRFSLQRLETPCPSSFLLEVAQTLLQVADDPNADLLSTSTYARRMFLLARDFSVPDESVLSPEEIERVQNILVNFISHTAYVIVRKYGPKWSERLYIQMRNKVAMAPQTERDFVYTETDYTRRMSDIMSRLAQLLQAYDFDLKNRLNDQLGMRIDSKTGDVERFEPIIYPKAHGCEILADNEWSRKLVEGPSAFGLALLQTQLHFDSNRIQLPVWKVCARYTLEYAKRFKMSPGLKDMLLYWSLWMSNYFDSMLLHGDDLSLLSQWLKALLGLISTSQSPEEQFVSGSIIAKALRYQQPEYAYDFCVDIMKTSNSPAEQFVVVETLKMLITGKITNRKRDTHDSIETSDSEHTCCSQERNIILDSEKRKQLTEIAGEAIFRLKKEAKSFPWYYLNFLAVVPTDPDTLLEFLNKVDAMISQCASNALSHSCQVQLNMVFKAIEQLRQQALNTKADEQQSQNINHDA